MYIFIIGDCNHHFAPQPDRAGTKGWKVGSSAIAENVFHCLGLNATPAITMFYRQVELRDGLPVDVVIPTPTTTRTLEASDAGRDLVVCEDADNMFHKQGI